MKGLLTKLFKDVMDGLALYAVSGAICPVTEEGAKLYQELLNKNAAKPQAAKQDKQAP